MLEAGNSFATETVFSHPSKLDIIDRARARGYIVIVMHVGIESPDLSVARVKARVQESGHDVPEDKIRARFDRGQPLIREAVLRADRGMVFDNSRLNEPPRQVLVFAAGKLSRVDPYLPQWVADDAPRLRRMMMTDAGQPLNYIIRDGEADLCLSPEARRLSDLPITPMRLSFADFDPIAHARAAERRERMVDRICTSFAKELEHQPRRAVVAAVDHALRLFGGYGFRTHAHLHFFAVWTVFYGPGFEARDPAGTLQAICRSPASEAERFKAFRDRFDSFTMRAA